MPVLVNVAANMLLGATLAFAVRNSDDMRDELLSVALLLLLGFETLVFTPIATLLFRFYPQWSMFYWFDPQVFPDLDGWTGPLSAIAVILNIAAAVGGFLAVRFALLRGPAQLVWAPFAAGGVLLVWTLAMFGRRVIFLGDYDEFWQGHAHLLIARLGGWLGIVLYASAVAFVLYVRRREPTLRL
jgi:hypothetical protein